MEVRWMVLTWLYRDNRTEIRRRRHRCRMPECPSWRRLCSHGTLRELQSDDTTTAVRGADRGSTLPIQLISDQPFKQHTGNVDFRTTTGWPTRYVILTRLVYRTADFQLELLYGSKRSRSTYRVIFRSDDLLSCVVPADICNPKCTFRNVYHDSMIVIFCLWFNTVAQMLTICTMLTLKKIDSVACMEQPVMVAHSFSYSS